MKRAAVETALTDATVEAVGVDPGVPEQPFGTAETIAGALGPFRTTQFRPGLLRLLGPVY